MSLERIGVAKDILRHFLHNSPILFKFSAGDVYINVSSNGDFHENLLSEGHTLLMDVI